MPEALTSSSTPPSGTTGSSTSVSVSTSGPPNSVIWMARIETASWQDAAMRTVQTVQGPIAADDLGTVLVHEHVRFRDEAVADQWPGFYDADAELAAALEAVRAAAAVGVNTIVDPTAMFGGRDVRFMRRVAEET